MGHMKDFDRRIRQGGDDAVSAALEYALTVAARWIPVEERLPEEGVSVLVNHWMTGIEMAYRRGDQWGITWTGFIGSGSGYSHWMPLPSPPEVT
jgi:hypothetical protein